jgi:hypothetical protein
VVNGKWSIRDLVLVTHIVKASGEAGMNLPFTAYHSPFSNLDVQQLNTCRYFHELLYINLLVNKFYGQALGQLVLVN